MAAPRVARVKDDEAEVKEPVVATPALEKPRMLMQEHAVQIGDRIQLNGSVFNVTSGIYAWHMVGPDGKDAPLTCDMMVSPYFIPEADGAYNVTLPTDDGMAEITIMVSKSL